MLRCSILQYSTSLCTCDCSDCTCWYIIGRLMTLTVTAIVEMTTAMNADRRMF